MEENLRLEYPCQVEFVIEIEVWDYRVLIYKFIKMKILLEYEIVR